MTAGETGPEGPSAAPDLELRQLRYFAAVAEAGTVTEAARRLRIAQPSLSQQLKRLERRVGAPLFRRLPHGMELTESGRLLLTGVDRALAVLGAALDAARAAPVTATVGVCRGVPRDVLERAERRLTAAGPLRLGYEPADSASQPELLRTGALAYGILRAPVADPAGLESYPLGDEPLGVVLHARHPLAGRTELTWADLSGLRLLWFPERRAPGYASAVLARLAEHGWRPDTVVEDSGSHTLFRHALAGHDDLVALRTRSAAGADADLLWRPVGPRPPRERLLLAVAGRTPWSGRLTDAPGGRPQPG
ncbi:LysR family transcriptional regulator [Streptomyces seoulensis]|nr:LysR family transcriptional regulator [Streptomyces seoulensis]